MTLWIENLKRLVALIDEKLAAANVETGPFSHADYDGWRMRHVAAETKVIAFFRQEEGASWASGSAYSLKMAGLRSSSTVGWTSVLQNWRASALKKIETADTASDNCSGHVASAADPKLCGRCGIHIDELRPDEDDPINLAGSGPVPIEAREG